MGRFVVVTVGRRHVADAHLGHADDMVHFRSAAQRVAVAVAHTVALVDEIQVRIEVDDVDRAAALEGLDHRRVHRVIAAEHHRHHAGIEDLAHGVFGVLVAGGHVGVDDVGITDVDHAHIRCGEVHHVIFVIVGAGVAEGKQRRCFTNPAWSEACAGAPLGAHVVGHAEHRDVGIQCIPIGAHRGFAKGAMTHEWQVQATGFITVVRHF
ncbi:hypothetical protein D3C73_809770 [compost metagenome]